VINIYAQNDIHALAQLWGEIADAVPVNCRWIVAGDFNFVEYRNDKTNSYGRMVPLSERLVFNDLKQRLQINEPPRSADSLRFSWDNLYQDGSRILAQLDRCYVFQSSGAANRKIISYKIKGDTGGSDHQLLIIYRNMCVQGGIKRGLLFFFFAINCTL
jgi:hypothetical protein